MPNDRIYYVICADNCKFEGMTKEQIFDAIAEATGHTPTPVDQAFITKIKEQNAQHNLKMWKGTEAEYNALSEIDPDTLYFVGGNKITPGGALTEIVPTNLGGTGQNFADFAALSDSVGSGGNVIDVTTEFLNGLSIYHSNYHTVSTMSQVCIYEKRFLSFKLHFYIDNAVSAGTAVDVCTLPTFANALASANFAGREVNAYLHPGGNTDISIFHLVNFTAGTQFWLTGTYLLETPYSE